jgi:urea carboxylase
LKKLERLNHACRCKACHPGYGFLSENVDFVEALEGKGVAFLGPTADTMRMFSRKHTAREFAESADVPVLPGEALHYRPLIELHQVLRTGWPKS